MLILLETMAEERRTATAPELLEPLMARLAGGDQEALAELYHRTRTSVYGLALSYLKNQHDAEDVTQDAFVRAWENAHQYRPQGTPLAWLLTIARNLALMKLRERGRTQDMALEDWERLAAENPMVTVEDRQVLDAAHRHGTTLTVYLAAVLFSAIHEEMHVALTALADDERQIVLLHAVTGWKHREIAGLLELPLSTVLSKYRRALLKLKTKLEGGDAL